MQRGLKRGDVLKETTSGKEFCVMDSIQFDGRISLLDRQSHLSIFLPLQDVYQRIAEQALKVVRKDAPVVPLVEHDSAAFLARLKWATKSLQAVFKTASKLGVSFDEAFRLVREEKKSEPFPTRSAIYRFKSRYLSGLPLLKGNKNKGCRKARYPVEVYELIQSHARLYCTPHSRWQMGAFVGFINQQAKELGYISPAKSISQRHISQTLKRTVKADLDACRLDPKNVAAERSIGARRIQANFPFERVEMDGLHLPFHVQTPHGVSSNVWCVHAIDVATGAVLGWKLVVGNPSENDGLDCIHSILFPKKDAFIRLGLNYDFDIFGTPSLIVFDNGAESKGERMEKLLLLSIDTEHCPARHPHKKPFIERLNRSLKTAIETLPGCTRLDGVDGKRDPMKQGDALMSLEDIERWIVRWYYEHWWNTTLDRHINTNPHQGTTPKDRWLYFTEKSPHVMALPITEDDWRKVTLVRSQRKLSSKTGVTYEGLNYKGRNLPDLIRRFYDSPVTMFADPRDYRFIYVDDGEQLIPLVEEYVNSDTPALSLEQYKEQRRSHLQQSHTAVVSEFDKDVWSASLQMKARKAPKKATQSNRETAQKHQASLAIQRAIDTPLNPEILVQPITKITDIPANLFDLPTLDVLDRNTGGSKL